MAQEKPSSAESPERAPQADRWEDYVDVFLSPVELFRRRAHTSPTHAVVTLVLVSLVLYFVMLPANAALFRESVSADARAAAFIQEYGLLIQIGMGLLAPVSVLVGVAFASLLLWLAAGMLEIRIRPRDAFLIATFAAFITLLGQAVAGLVAMLGDGPVDPVRDLSFGVLRFTGDDAVPHVLVPLLGRLDVFAIWQAVVWAIGVRVVGNATRAQAVLAAGAAWLLYALPRTLLAALPQPTPPTGPA